jgi:hypothetical protein
MIEYNLNSTCPSLSQDNRDNTFSGLAIPAPICLYCFDDSVKVFCDVLHDTDLLNRHVDLAR